MSTVSAQAPIQRPSIMARLRESTAAHHDQTESHPFPQDLVAGKLPLAGYVNYLAQMFLIHKPLESALAQWRDSSPHAPATRLVDSEQFKTPCLLNDLAWFSVDPASIVPAPATRRLMADVDRRAGSRPVSLLGMHYVLEGSTNGGKFIARAAQKAYGLATGAGTNYLDPYRDTQRQRWLQFKSAMDAAEFSAHDADEMADAAAAMFIAIGAIFDDLVRMAAEPVR